MVQEYILPLDRYRRNIRVIGEIETVEPVRPLAVITRQDRHEQVRMTSDRSSKLPVTALRAVNPMQELKSMWNRFDSAVLSVPDPSKAITYTASEAKLKQIKDFLAQWTDIRELIFKYLIQSERSVDSQLKELRYKLNMF